MHASGIDAAVAAWLSRDDRRRCFTLDRTLPGRPKRSAAFPGELFPGELGVGLGSALRERGIQELYVHQREAWEAVQARRNVVIATPTASGKSLCFHLPVLDALARDPNATALYLYPTKALARDQEQALRALAHDAGIEVGAAVYDGDTPGDARRSTRESARILMTNPDMLHAGILPQHAAWARLFQSLRFVVVDELHTYRGVFGSHVAHVLGRLSRVAQFHGAAPMFLGATATIGNPAEHAARLFGVENDALALVDRSGAPHGERRLFVYNPPVVNAELGIRESYLKASVRLTVALLKAGVRTLLFGQSRNAVEIMLKYLRDRFTEHPHQSIHGDPITVDSIVAYRGGYLPEMRRGVERGLREGHLLCVVATSALELGIDAGELDAVVCAGYPGTLAETWQRFGRAGRRGMPALALLVASSAPLDQYLATHPELLLEGSIEHARIDPQNTEVLVQHLKCAAFELPFTRTERYTALGPDDTALALGFLAKHGVVHPSANRYHWATDAFPANQVSLRRVGWDNFVIVDTATDEALAELDWHSAPRMLHEQAIYQHDGHQYQVEKLDYENHKAFVRQVEPDYFTTALVHVKVKVIQQEALLPPPHKAPGEGVCETLGWGEVAITEQVVGYKKVKFHTHENAGYGDVRLPEVDMHTTAFWITLAPELCAVMGRATAIEGLAGLAHALELMVTLALMCDPHDIGRAIEDGAPDDDAGTFAATAYLYDTVPGGIGLSERIFGRAADLLERARRLVSACPCPNGCPSCVGATAAAAHLLPVSGPTRKYATLALFERLAPRDQAAGRAILAACGALGSL
jgi:DEAD/DEAH box helicase domain-containing protein